MSSTTEYTSRKLPLSSLLKGGASLSRTYFPAWILIVFLTALQMLAIGNEISPVFAFLFNAVPFVTLCFVITGIWLRLPLPGRNPDEARKHEFKKGMMTLFRVLGLQVILMGGIMLINALSLFSHLFPLVGTATQILSTLFALLINSYMVFFLPFMVENTFMDRNLAKPWRACKTNNHLFFLYFSIQVFIFAMVFAAAVLLALSDPGTTPSPMPDKLSILSYPVEFFFMLCVVHLRRLTEPTPEADSSSNPFSEVVSEPRQ